MRFQEEVVAEAPVPPPGLYTRLCAHWTPPSACACQGLNAVLHVTWLPAAWTLDLRREGCWEGSGAAPAGQATPVQNLDLSLSVVWKLLEGFVFPLCAQRFVGCAGTREHGLSDGGGSGRCQLPVLKLKAPGRRVSH